MSTDAFVQPDSGPLDPTANTGGVTIDASDDHAVIVTESTGTIATGTESLLAAIGGIGISLNRLVEEFDARFRYDDAKEKAFDRLYADLEAARADSEFDRSLPLYRDLILMFDRIDKAAETPAKDSTLQSGGSEFLLSLRDELLEVLSRRGVEPICPSPAVFDARLQRVVGLQLVDGEDKDNSVVAVVRKGFRSGQRLVRAEEVIVRKHQKPSPTASTVTPVESEG